MERMVSIVSSNRMEAVKTHRGRAVYLTLISIETVINSRPITQGDDSAALTRALPDWRIPKYPWDQIPTRGRAWPRSFDWNRNCLTISGNGEKSIS